MAKMEMEIRIRIVSDDAGPPKVTWTVVESGETVLGPEAIECVFAIAKTEGSTCQPFMFGDARELGLVIYSYYRTAKQTGRDEDKGIYLALENVAELIGGDIALAKMDEKGQSH
jgi:hypothetical protein